MPYNPALVSPMRQEMTSMGARELTSAADVDSALGDQRGTMLVFVNSVCGCAAGNARPALRLALQHAVKPAEVVTVEPTGSETQVFAKLGTQKLVGAFRERVTAKPGEPLPFMPNLDAVHLCSGVEDECPDARPEIEHHVLGPGVLRMVVVRGHDDGVSYPSWGVPRYGNVAW